MSHAQWKTDVDTALASASTLITNPVATGCQLPEVENPNYQSWLAGLQTQTSDLLAHASAMPTACVPPPSGPVSGWLEGKTWQVGVKKTVAGATNLSGCCWSRERNVILATDETTLVEFDIHGNTLRTISLDNPPINPTNGATLNKKFESISFKAEGENSDTVSLLYEGSLGQEPEARIPIMLVLELPHDATSLDLSSGALYVADTFFNDTECSAWNEALGRWHLFRSADSFGYMLADGTTVNQGVPPGTYPRKKSKDCCINLALSPCVFTLGSADSKWYIEERDASTGVILVTQELTPLIEYRPHEGLAISDNGSIFVVDEADRFTRLDLV